jgi:SAM-dependent methyltransferase
MKDVGIEGDDLYRLIGGFSATQMLYTAVSLGIAELLQDGSRSVKELTVALRADEHALYRFLRMLVVLGLLTEETQECFALSRSGDRLRSDHPQSVRDRILYVGEISYMTARATTHSVITGKPAFDHVFDLPYFDYLAQHPKQNARFSRLMSASLGGRIARVMDSYDFSEIRLVADIGGGQGHLLAAILKRYADVQGILFDTPAVVSEATGSWVNDPNAHRMRFVGGDLFADPLPCNADMYILSNILHDWGDDASLGILRNCRAAVHPRSRLLLIEDILPARVEDAPGTIANDFSMLLLTGGQQRSVEQFRSLLGKAGFSIDTVHPMGAIQEGLGKRQDNWAIIACTPLASQT